MSWLGIVLRESSYAETLSGDNDNIAPSTGMKVNTRLKLESWDVRSDYELSHAETAISPRRECDPRSHSLLAFMLYWLERFALQHCTPTAWGCWCVIGASSILGN